MHGAAQAQFFRDYSSSNLFCSNPERSQRQDSLMVPIMLVVSVVLVIRLREAKRTVQEELQALKVRTPSKRSQVDGVTQLGFAQEICGVFFF